ncbi:MAG: T9SS type A sorting domain-containing protein [Chitinivibrionales bacterium]|nr:T9SS type A sorting domain-containing protein [Chitinivibrionales bacterium]
MKINILIFPFIFALLTQAQSIPPLLSFSLTIQPSDVINVGDTAYCSATVTDNIGSVRRDYDSQIQWMLIDTSAANPALSNTIGAATKWSPTRANVQVKIVGVLNDAASGRVYRDTLILQTAPGAPNKLVLYPHEGVPNSNNKPLPGDTTIATGYAFPLTAKIFDSGNNWLPFYENTDSLKYRITWSINDTSAGKLSSYIGDKVTFSGVKILASALITARHIHDLQNFMDTIRITLSAGMVDHLLIKSSKAQSVSFGLSTCANSNSSILRVGLNQASSFTIKIYDLSGKELFTFSKNNTQAGLYSIKPQIALTQGLYMATMSWGSRRISKILPIN